jgi:hypothetical protein
MWSVGRTLLVLFRWGVFLLACAFLYAQLSAPKGTAALDALRTIPRPLTWWAQLAGIVALMLLNWGIESHKWRWLMRPVELIGRRQAFLATVAGTSVSLITPNRTGEFVGRVLFLAPENRVAGAFATALGGIAQFVVTLVAGGSSLALMHLAGLAMPWPMGWSSTALVSLTALVTVGSLVLYFQPGILRQLLLLVPFLRRMERTSVVLNGYVRRELMHVLALSALRYLVFGLQFVWALGLFESGVSMGEAILAVPVIYLIATVVPTFLLTELGVRGSASVGLLIPLGAAAAPVLLATFTVWAINLVLPALAGSIILLFARIRTRRS